MTVSFLAFEKKKKKRKKDPDYRNILLTVFFFFFSKSCITDYTINSDFLTKLNDFQDGKEDVSIVREWPMKCYLALMHGRKP